MNTQQTKIQFANGSAALALFSDSTFCQQWDELYVHCPWATALQTRTFAEIWYAVYQPMYEPVIIYAHHETKGLLGLFALAVELNSGNLVHVGAEQAEYQVWLAMPEHGDTFIELALNTLATKFPKADLTLRFLPPNTPLAWIESTHRWAQQVCKKEVIRPLMAVGEGSSIEASLRKKSNKSRLNRMGKLGTVRLEVFRSRQEIEPIFDRIIELCNFRNGARYQNIPFQDDPLKKEFYLRLIDAPSITHTSVFCAGDEILAMNIGARDKSSVQVGLHNQSPFASEHSPGKFLLLFLGRELATEGYSDLDLTPSPSDLGYKQRFADHYDTAYICNISLSSGLPARLNKIKFQLKEIAKLALAKTGISHETIRVNKARILQLIKGYKPQALLINRLQWLARRVYSNSPYKIYQLNIEQLTQIPSDHSFNRNSLHDLLLYQANTPDAQTIFDFLDIAFNRLTAGSYAYTQTNDKRLVYSAWLSPITGTTLTELGNLEVPKGSVLLSDDSLADWNSELYQASIHNRLQDALTMAKEGKILISIPNNESACQVVENMGFHLYAVITRGFRLGITTWRWTRA